MEKICIVKLRKNFGTRLAQEAQEREETADDNRDAAARRVALTLTTDQTRILQSDPHMASLLYEKSLNVSGKVGHCQAELTIQLELPPLPPVRLLKLGEVTRMLRISRSSLQRILHEGELHSYKLGRLRRVMLDDVLSYLESHQESPPGEERPAMVKTPLSGVAQP
jgi:excisionase family DNA binding protein